MEVNTNRLAGLGKVLDLDVRHRTIEEFLPLQYKYQGILSVVPGAACITAVRAGMAEKAHKTAMPLRNATIPIVSTGAMVAMARYAQVIKMGGPENESVYIERIIRINKNKYFIKYSYGDTVESMYVRNFVKGHEKFGYPLYFTDAMLNLKTGNYVKVGEILADSTQRHHGMVTLTIDVPTIAATLNEGNEDAMVISDTYAKEATYDVYYKVSLDVKQGDILLNMHGDKEKYKPIPEVGDTLSLDGVILGKRKIPKLMSPALMSNKALMEYNEAFDTMVYLPAGVVGEVEVVDIEVISTNRNHNNPTMFQIDEMVKIDGELLDKVKQGNDMHRTLGPNYIKFLRYEHSKKVNKNLELKGARVDTNIKIIVKSTTSLLIDNKISGPYGNKGIVCDIRPEKDMPRMEDGTIIHLIIECATTGNRNNSPVVSVGSLGTQFRQIRNLIRLRCGSPDIHTPITDYDYICDLPEVDILWAFDYYMGALKLIQSPLYEGYLDNTYQEKVDEVYGIVSDEARVIIPPPDNALLLGFEALETSEYRIVRQKVYMSDALKRDNVLIFEDECSYSMQSMIVQNKIGERPIATSTPPENHYSLPTNFDRNFRYNRQLKYSAVRIAGGPDIRIFTGALNPEPAMEFIEMGKSSEVRSYAYGTLLRSPFPSNVEKAVDRNHIPFGRDPFTRLYQSLTKSVGYMPERMDMGYTEMDKFNSDILYRQFQDDQEEL